MRINVKWQAYSHNEEKYVLKQNGVHIGRQLASIDILNSRQGLNALYAIIFLSRTNIIWQLTLL